MTAMGVDVAQGGADGTVLSARFDAWFAKQVVRPGTETPDGPSLAALVVAHARDGAPIGIDTGGGWGGSLMDHLRANGIACPPRDLAQCCLAPVVLAVGIRTAGARRVLPLRFRGQASS